MSRPIVLWRHRNIDSLASEGESSSGSMTATYTTGRANSASRDDAISHELTLINADIASSH